MKKHQVDDLFARKLRDWQPKPSADLWKQIEDRQEGKIRRLAGWYWYAAASVALMMVSYVVWISRSEVLPGTNREFAVVDQIRESKVDTAGNGASIANGRGALANSGIQENENRVLPQGMKVPRQSEQATAGKEYVVQPGVLEAEPVLDRLEVAAIQKIETAPESLVPDVKSKIVVHPLEVHPEITNESLVAQAEGRVIIAHIETSEVGQEDHRSSKFIRILRQLKNAKQGEAIEWDEVGFNPKKLMARADERLRNEEEKVSKRYQELKDKTNL